MADNMEQGPEMEEEMPEQEAGAEQGDPLDVVKKLESSLLNLKQAIGDIGAPAEIMAPLDASIQSFGEFVSMMTGSAPAPKGGQSVQDANAMGAKGAVPADQYTGKGVKAVRA